MRRILFLLPLALGPLGCTSWQAGTIAPGQLESRLQASAPRSVQPLQLASLGAPVHSRYLIQAGDLLDVSVSNLVGEGQAYPVPTRVQPDGSVRLPLVGTVTVANLTLPEAEMGVFASYASQGLLKDPQVVVALHETRKVRVFLLGAVKNPGQFDLNGNESDLLSALVAAGGLTNEAGTVVEIRHRLVPDPVTPRWDSQVARAGSETADWHPAKAGRVPSAYAPVPAPVASVSASPSAQAQVVRLDLTDEQDKATLAEGVQVQNGDIISVEERQIKPIYVLGMVNKPGDYTIPPNRAIRVLEAVGLAGGVDRNSLPDKAVVIRQRPDQLGVVVIRVDLNRAKRNMAENILLMPGDTVSVEETALSYMRGVFRGAFRLGLGASVAPNYGF
ncbi:MAG TPA: polysaccharide biosynthesis/export family protein [Gemmataceae bacterium]|nr:polysaccharide biosynthesis/export family protein [Gemmataceae bacterium]